MPQAAQANALGTIPSPDKFSSRKPARPEIPVYENPVYQALTLSSIVSEEE
jgi:hypothetical protein